MLLDVVVLLLTIRSQSNAVPSYRRHATLLAANCRRVRSSASAKWTSPMTRQLTVDMRVVRNDDSFGRRMT
ncbi:MAG: hypothetical protein HC888_16130 [Candidatus Competibacteraceae bacterium]|nr:hypothetical protein [Candidatus Competibacteraceae bacterium]